ncbi:hypothetical protein [Rhodoferax sp.]|uniref:hypothetical protein n=1 Tax=Rhodoferax sp. TaxID=50421 RepID=UPI00284B1351|nr:hypothetical protein [Rhodoferax sp.]MDR3368023.1 hypothetical protein [Rhodoferax sp.]
MFSSPEFFKHPPRRLIRAGLLAFLAVTMLAAGCASHVDLRENHAANGTEPTTVATCSQPCVAESPISPAAPATDNVLQMLAYAERTRHMQAAELNQEVVRLGDVAGPTEQMQLALVLSQFHQLPELTSAQELLGRVLANPNAEAQALHPLAGLLAARFAEQRRLEDMLDKQTQQMRDVQRRLDQTNERLEALKAIERSLTNRLSPAPASRSSRTPSP